MKKTVPVLCLLLFFIPLFSSQQDTTLNTNRLNELKNRVQLYSQILIRQKESNSQTPEPLFQININANVIDSMFKYIPEISKISLQSDLNKSDTLLLYLAELINNQKRTKRKGIVQFGDNVIVGRNEYVTGDVVVVGGDAEIYGEVKGGVIVVLGNIRLASTSIVHKDVVSVWGSPDIDNGAQIIGTTNIFNFKKMFSPHFFRIRPFTLLPVIIRFIWFLFLFTVIIAIYYSFKEPVENIRDQIKNNYLRSLVTGILSIILIPALFLILVTTIIGIPLALFVLPLTIIAAFLTGITACSLSVGHHILPRTGLKTDSVLAALFAGLLAIELPSLISRITSLFSPVLTTTFSLAASIIIIIAWIPGLGAVILTKFGRNKPTDTGNNAD
ncbi:hypothetical protein DRQ07_08775 [candidate division KSB1 bacterium]|nr:MAG: hypothetical protein DRQ07_08775 [candidate division KSB1 bacterium]